MDSKYIKWLFLILFNLSFSGIGCGQHERNPEKEAEQQTVKVDSAQYEIFNISSGSPFQKEDLIELKHHAPIIIARYYPEAVELYERNQWTLPESIDRVYRSDKAMQSFGYHPKFTFEYLLKGQK